MSDVFSRQSRPLRVAIVGAGPSGFYATDALFKLGQEIHVSVFDRLATPYGLLRHGVAPDHQKIKSLAAYYEKIALKHPDQFRFYGNISIGEQVQIQDLQRYFDAIILTYGCESDRSLSIKGAQLDGLYSAREFVAWYNSHPDYQDLNVPLTGRSAAIIGIGNVAIDVARLLAKNADELAVTDLSTQAFQALTHSQITDIHIIARRGPAQAACTSLELEELGELADCDVIVKPEDLHLSKASQDECSSLKVQKNIAAFTALSQKPRRSVSKTITIHFNRSPQAILGQTCVTGISLNEMQLSGEAFSQRPQSTGVQHELACDLVFSSIGYRGTAMAGVPFDEKQGTIPHQDGQVTHLNGEAIPGLYTAGWIKRGATGVIGTNKSCAQESVKRLLAQLDQLPVCKYPNSNEFEAFLTKQAYSFCSFQDWQKIDHIERTRGEALGKPRLKFTRTDDILNAVAKQVT